MIKPSGNLEISWPDFGVANLVIYGKLLEDFANFCTVGPQRPLVTRNQKLGIARLARLARLIDQSCFVPTNRLQNY